MYDNAQKLSAPDRQPNITESEMSAGLQAAKNDQFVGNMQKINISSKMFAQEHTQLSQTTREFDPLRLNQLRIATGS